MQLPDFKLGMAQMLVEGGEPEANLSRAEAKIASAAALGCRVVVLPECMDLGWTHPSARNMAASIPGPRTERLAKAARRFGLFGCSGLLEQAGAKIYNAAVLIGPDGRLLLHHRKINELSIALDLYSVGDRLGVVETELCTFGLNICADNFSGSLSIGHVLARMGAQVILSPASWATEASHDNVKEPYGALWRTSYAELARLYDLTVIGVSNVGWIDAGPWKGRKVIGCSLAMGSGGKILAQAPYGEAADGLTVVEIHPLPRLMKGSDLLESLESKGYRGP